MGRAVCKVTVHKGGGGEHVSYMTRVDALAQEKPVDHSGREDRARETIEVPLTEHESDPIWTCNTPSYITGDDYERQEEKSKEKSPQRSASAQINKSGNTRTNESSAHDLTLDDKRHNAQAHFQSLCDYEEARGGVSHYRIILTVSKETANKDLRTTVNKFLGQTFPQNPALICIHNDTDHKHAHLLVISRQTNGKRIDLKGDYFRIDERWMDVAAEHFKDQEIYNNHYQLKQLTIEWKEKRNKAIARGELIPPKPDRHRDHWEVWNSDKPWSDHWCGRVAHKLKVHELKLQYQQVTGAQAEVQVRTQGEIRVLREKYEMAADLRHNSPDRRGRLPSDPEFQRSPSKRVMPPEIPTVAEVEKIRFYQQEIKRNKQQQVKEYLSEKAAPEYPFERVRINTSPAVLTSVQYGPKASPQTIAQLSIHKPEIEFQVEEDELTPEQRLLQLAAAKAQGRLIMLRAEGSAAQTQGRSEDLKQLRCAYPSTVTECTRLEEACQRQNIPLPPAQLDEVQLAKLEELRPYIVAQEWEHLINLGMSIPSSQVVEPRLTGQEIQSTPKQSRGMIQADQSPPILEQMKISNIPAPEQAEKSWNEFDDRHYEREEKETGSRPPALEPIAQTQPGQEHTPPDLEQEFDFEL